jgi:DNA-binding transcriptional MerR regulator
MMHEQGYTIGDLADAAGVTPRTIRYYTTEGLLPPPDTRGKYARYRHIHLLRLQIIARLKEAYLPLGEIRTQLERLSNEELEVLLKDTEGAGTPKPASAIEYITDLIGPRANIPIAEQREGYVHTPRPAGIRRESSPQLQADTSGSEHIHKQRLADFTATPNTQINQYHTDDHKQDQALHPPRTSSEQWRRITLAAGIELHIREPNEFSEQINRLVKLARSFFIQEDLP